MKIVNEELRVTCDGIIIDIACVNGNSYAFFCFKDKHTQGGFVSEYAAKQAGIAHVKNLIKI